MLIEKQDRTLFAGWCALALIAVCAAYANSFHNGFHFDDFHTVVDNPSIRSLKNIPTFFTNANTFSVLPTNRTYRPIVSASLAFDYALGRGYSPIWFHVGTFICFLNLLGLLVLFYAKMMARTDSSRSNIYIALAGAAWFGLHPAMAETVNYIIQRGDIYCTLGCVAALTMYACSGRLKSFGIYLLPLTFALLAKPPAAIFPALLFFYVFFFEYPEGEARWKKSFIATIPSLVLTAGLMLLQHKMTPKSFSPSVVPPWDYRLTQPFVWLRYATALFFPLHLNVDTDLTPISHLNPQELSGFAFVVILAVAIWQTSRKRELYPIAYGLIWFILTQLPTSLYPLSEVENDHRMFFSFVGLILAVVWSVKLIIERLTKSWPTVRVFRVTTASIVIFMSVYAYGTRIRNSVWHDEESLWRDDVKKSPHNGRGLMTYGVALMGRGAYADALSYFLQASEWTPNYPTLEINLGVANGALDRPSEAEHHFLRAIVLAPTDDLTHAYYGRWLIAQGRPAEAITQLKIALALNQQRPMQRDLLLTAYRNAAAQASLVRSSANFANASDSATWVNQSLVLNQKGRYQESIRAAQMALKTDPNNALAWNNIAAANESLHQWDQAISAAQRAIALKPDFQLARNNLVWSESQKLLAERDIQH